MANKRNRDYSLEYERRRIRAQGRGFTSPAEQTRYNREKKKYEAAGKKLTVYNFRQKTKATQKKTAIKNKKARLTAIGTPAALKRFNVSQNTFNRMRAENRKYDKTTAWGKGRYKLDIDADINNFSEDRIGYIVGYNQVFVHPKTKKLSGKARMAQVAAYEKLSEQYELLNDEAVELYGYNKSGGEMATAA